MAFDNRSLDDYVDVAQRIADFRELYPHGSLQPADPAHPWEQAVVNGVSKDGKPYAMTMIVYVAAAYRTPDDPRPGIGVAWEAFPGRTPYTLGSELMNAETSAWGRAIIAVLASDSKRGVASRDEVAARRAERDDGLPTNKDGSLSRSQTSDEEKDAAGVMTDGQLKEHTALGGGNPKTSKADRARITRVRPADKWDGQPAGEFEPGETSLPDRRRKPPTTAQLIRAHWKRLGISDDDEAHIWTAKMAGRTELASTNNLPPEQQQDILTALAQCKDIGKVQAWIDDKVAAS